MLREPAPQIVPVGPAQLQQLSGLEILAAQLEGKIPAAPIDRYAGIRLIEAEDGRVVFSLPVHSGLVQELETVFGGVIALLAKSASGAAVQTIAPAGTNYRPGSQGELPAPDPRRGRGADRYRLHHSSRQKAEHSQRRSHLPRPPDCDRHRHHGAHSAGITVKDSHRPPGIEVSWQLRGPYTVPFTRADTVRVSVPDTVPANWPSAANGVGGCSEPLNGETIATIAWKRGD